MEAAAIPSSDISRTRRRSDSAGRSPESPLLKCAICQGRYHNPKVLPCLHTFCESCLIDFTPAQSLTLTCPICRQQSILPEEGVAALQNNFVITDMMEVSGCSMCTTESPAVQLCKDCNASFCQACADVHAQKEDCTNHTLVKVEDEKGCEKKALENDNDDRCLYCPSHTDQRLRFFCRECARAVCISCTDIEHRDHLTTKLTEAASEHRKALREAVDKACTQVPAVTEALEQLNSVKNGLDDRRTSAELQIHACFDSLAKTLEQRRNDILTQLDATYAFKNQVLTCQIEELMSWHEEVMAAREMCERAIAAQDDTRLLLIQTQLTDRLNHAAVQTIPTIPRENHQMGYQSGNVSKIIESLQDVGRVFSNSALASQSTITGEGLKQCWVKRPTVLTVATRDYRGDPVTTGGAELEASLRNLASGGSESIHSPNITDLGNGLYEVSYNVNVEGRYELGVMLSGEHVRGSPVTVSAVIEDENSSSERPASKLPRTSIGGTRGRASQSRGRQSTARRSTPSSGMESDLMLRVGYKGRCRGEFTNPQGVCVSANGRVLVTDSNNQCVQVFTLDGECRLRFGVRGRAPGQLQRPTGIDISDEGLIAVSDYDNRCVTMFDQHGKYKCRIGYGKLLGPKGVIWDRLGRLLVVDNKASCVLVFGGHGDQMGRMLGKFGSRGVHEHQFAGPHFIATDSNNRIIVSDFHNHSVKVFDSEGEFLLAFGSNGEGNGQFNAPTGIAVDENDNILVADWGNSRIQAFDSQGSFLAYVATGGEALYGPQGISISSEGHVVVADSGNHCFKVYRFML